jgi:hypothetical protein
MLFAVFNCREEDKDISKSIIFFLIFLKYEYILQVLELPQTKDGRGNKMADVW